MLKNVGPYAYIVNRKFRALKLTSEYSRENL